MDRPPQKKANAETEHKAKEEAKKKADSEAKRREEDRRRAEEKEKRRQAEEQAKRKADEEEQRAEAERKAEEDRKRREAEEEQTYMPVLKTYTNSIGMEFVLIPAGEFMMGSKLSPAEVVQLYGGKADWFKNENPQHSVEISKSFYIQTTQVTQSQWKAVMQDNPSFFKDCGDDCPVEQIAWVDVQDFIKKLNKIEKTDKYRLPTEAEWECACRANTETVFSFGNEANRLGEYAWYSDNSEGKTHPVANKRPNAWGLYDMHGNVSECCQDCRGGYPSTLVKDPVGPSNESARVLRGGSWFDNRVNARCAYRFMNDPFWRDSLFGFRCARSS